MAWKTAAPQADGVTRIPLAPYIGDGSGEIPAGASFFAGRHFGLAIIVTLPPGDWMTNGMVPPLIVRLLAPLSGEELDSTMLAPVAEGAMGATGGFGAAAAAARAAQVAANTSPVGATAPLFDNSEPQPIAGQLSTHLRWRSPIGWEFIADERTPRLELTNPVLQPRRAPPSDAKRKRGER